jgi:transcriptional regulator with XRE-family HTH domain
MKLCKQFGGTLRLAREENGWSQEVLADKAGLNRSYLGEIERGSAMPSLATVAKLADALGINLSALIARCEHSLATIE